MGVNILEVYDALHTYIVIAYRIQNHLDCGKEYSKHWEECQQIFVGSEVSFHPKHSQENQNEAEECGREETELSNELSVFHIGEKRLRRVERHTFTVRLTREPQDHANAFLAETFRIG